MAGVRYDGGKSAGIVDRNLNVDNVNINTIYDNKDENVSWTITMA